jgi:uncharacterized protein (UPF0261 family)
LLEDNLWPNGTVYYNSGNNDPNPNQYNSNAFNAAAYISDEFNPSERLKAIIGLRASILSSVILDEMQFLPIQVQKAIILTMKKYLIHSTYSHY